LWQQGLTGLDEVEVLEDLIVAAYNDAKSRAESRVHEEMVKLTGGHELPPGFKMPFGRAGARSFLAFISPARIS